VGLDSVAAQPSPPLHCAVQAYFVLGLYASLPPLP
jgi:hypothetical protein